MRTRRYTLASLLGIGCALVLCGILSLARAADEKSKTPPFSRKLDFVIGKEIPLDAVVGGVRFASINVESEKWKSGGYHLWLRIAAANPKHNHDQKVWAHVQLADKEGTLLASDEAERGIEDGDDSVLKLSAHLDADPASVVATLLLELDAWED
jgi:hypothetical protein